MIYRGYQINGETDRLRLKAKQNYALLKDGIRIGSATDITEAKTIINHLTKK